MKFLTFNIRTEAACDGVNRFHFRKGFIMDKLEAEMPDIIGFQEMKPEMHDYMVSHLLKIGYYTFGCGRNADYTGEHNPIAFRMDKYEMLALDVTWLSDTPLVPGSRFEQQSVCPRLVTHMILKPLESDKPFHVYNTHLDHKFDEAREKGAVRLMEKIKADNALYPFPVILCGDFNAYPDSLAMATVRNDEFGLTEFTEGIGTTWHAWGTVQEPQIDYIFAKGFEKTSDVVLWKDELNGVYLSDHYPVEVSMEREAQA